MPRFSCKDHSEGTCTSSFCKKWHHPPECSFYKTKSGCKFVEKWCTIVRPMNNLIKGLEQTMKNDLHESIRTPFVNHDKSHDRPGRPDVKRDTCRELKQGPVGRQSSELGCVFQDMESPKSSTILRTSSDIRKPIRCVKCTKAVVRHADISRPKIHRDRSQEETEWQTWYAVAHATDWRLPQRVQPWRPSTQRHKNESPKTVQPS